MTYTPPTSATALGTLTVTQWNTQVKGNIEHLYSYGTTLAGTAGTAWSVTAIAGTAGTAVNVTSTQGSVTSTQGSVVSVAGTVTNIYNSQKLLGSVERSSNMTLSGSPTEIFTPDLIVSMTIGQIYVVETFIPATYFQISATSPQIAQYVLTNGAGGTVINAGMVSVPAFTSQTVSTYLTQAGVNCIYRHTATASSGTFNVQAEAHSISTGNGTLAPVGATMLSGSSNGWPNAYIRIFGPDLT